MKPKIYTIIPARSGSKSIPHKNIKILGGRPMMAYSIDYSLKCKLVNKTIVSTDSEHIADIAKSFGADVPFLRPKKYARDDSLDFDFLVHAALWLREYDTLPKYFVLLRPTSPFRPKRLIEQGMKLMLKNPSADSLRTVALCSEHPYRMWKSDKRYISPICTNEVMEPFTLPRQHLPDIYFQTGDMEIIKTSTILNKASVAGDKILPLILNKKDMIDIDNVTDMKKAEEIIYDRRKPTN